MLVLYKRFKMFVWVDILKQLGSIFFYIPEMHRFEIYAMEVMEGHKHLFIGLCPSQSIAQVIQYLKGGSSRELRKVFPELEGYSISRLWSRSKYLKPIGEVNDETIKHYILESQSKHHNEGSKRPLSWLQKELKTAKTPQRILLEFAC